MLPSGCTTLYYADDTVLIASESTFEEAIARAQAGVAAVVNAIKRLGLKVSPRKTDRYLRVVEKALLPVELLMLRSGDFRRRPYQISGSHHGPHFVLLGSY